MKTIKPLDLVNEQYQLLMARLSSTKDLKEKNQLLRRLGNLLAVAQFLISLNKGP